MRLPSQPPIRVGGRTHDDNYSCSNESGSVKGFNCLYDQSFHAEDESIALSNSTDTGVEPDRHDERSKDDRSALVDEPDSGSEFDELPARESGEDDNETSSVEWPLGRGQVIIHTSPVYSEHVREESPRKLVPPDEIQVGGFNSRMVPPKDIKVGEFGSRGHRAELPEELSQDSEFIKQDVFVKGRRRRVFALGTIFGKPSRVNSARTAESYAVNSSKTFERSAETQAAKKVSDKNTVSADDTSKVDIENKSLGSDDNPLQDQDGSPSLVEENEETKSRRGLFRNRSRSIKATDDDGGTVSSKKSFGSRLSEGSKKSLASLRSRISLRFREKREPRDDLDDESVDAIDSTSIVSRPDEKKRLFMREEDEEPFWFNVRDSCYFFQCMCEPSPSTVKDLQIPEGKKRRFFFLSR